MPSQEIIEVDEKTDLLQALTKKGMSIRSDCGGHASCSTCIIKIVSGEEYTSAPGFIEIQLLGNVFHITKERLSCQTKITGDVVIDISGHGP